MITSALLSFCLAAAGADPAGDAPPVFDVEGQPLGANVKRLIDALEYLGAPLSSENVTEWRTAADERDATRLQKLVDPNVLLVVHLNPESRVKVRRGPSRGELQQGGFTPVLVKVLNESTVTKRMRVVSPQAGAVYAGAAKFSLQRQQQTELNDQENTPRDPGRFLAVEMFDQPPMTDRLSGLAVEYAIALIYSSESGQREATIGFDLGQGEQDLGFRGETPVLFDVRPAVRTKLSVQDFDGAPTVAAILFRDRFGRVYPPQAKRLAPDLFFQPHIYRGDGETVWLPPGEFAVHSGRGPEYRVREQKITVPAQGESLVDIRLERWVNPRDFGFFSGDHHIHAAGCAHYTSPTEGVSPADMFRQVKGEGLNVGCVLTWGPCYRFQRQFFSPRPNDVSDPQTILKYDLEISGFGSQALGHVCLLNLKDQTYPGSDGTETKGWPTWTTPVMRWAKEQGGVTGYAHSASGLAIDPAAAAKRLSEKLDADRDGQISRDEAAPGLLPESFATIDADGDGQLSERELVASHDRAADQLPNLAIPEMNGVGAMEICVTAAEGVCDFISAMDTRRIQEWNTWYHLLNCGFPIKVSGETDFPCMSSRRVGQGRVYVRLGPRETLEFGDWCMGLAKGRSYVSDGFAHALEFSVQGTRPGENDVTLDAAEKVEVVATVCFAPETPEAVAQGIVTPRGGRRLVGDTVELHGPRSEKLAVGGDRLVEVVVNGHAAASQKVPADGKIHELRFSIPVERSSWVALRHFPQLHTNPVHVIVAGRPIRASRESARWCEETIDLLWKNRQNAISPAERDEARETFDRAKKTYQQIAAES